MLLMQSSAVLQVHIDNFDGPYRIQSDKSVNGHSLGDLSPKAAIPCNLGFSFLTLLACRRFGHAKGSDGNGGGDKSGRGGEDGRGQQ
jgi:hypothetical protein